MEKIIAVKTEVKKVQTLTLKKRASDDVRFMDAYQKAGLPISHTITFPGRKKRSTSHATLPSTRQYSKFLKGKGLVYNSPREV